jgi:Zn-dependent protease with chaperone function
MGSLFQPLLTGKIVTRSLWAEIAFLICVFLKNAAFYYSHPPVVERVRRLQEQSTASAGGS